MFSYKLVTLYDIKIAQTGQFFRPSRRGGKLRLQIKITCVISDRCSAQYHINSETWTQITIGDTAL
jgi:hypothetical protein